MRKTFVNSCLVMFFLLLTPMADAKFKIGITWFGKSGMTRRVVAGFMDGMSNSASEFEFEKIGELKDVTAMHRVIQKFQKEKDGMLVLRSGGAKYLKKNTPTIPTFLGGCNNPKIIGAINNLEEPEGKMTGVTYYIPVKSKFETFKAFFPKMKSLYLVLEKGHPSSDVELYETNQVCKELKLKCKHKHFSKVNEILKVVREQKGNVDFFILGSQALMMDNAYSIIQKAGNTPVLSYAEAPVDMGALVGFAANDHKLGKHLAQSVIDVFKNKMPIKKVPVKMDESPRLKVNVLMAEKFGLKIPFVIMNAATLIKKIIKTKTKKK